jgi:hypothetical protein
MSVIPSPDRVFPVYAPLAERLTALVQAYEYARELRRPAGDFALELEALRAAGFSNSDLRWLTCQGYVEHFTESTPPGARQRVLRPVAHLGLTACSCFVLTDAGAALAGSRALADGRPLGAKHQAGPNGGRRAGSARPAWDADLRELWLGPVLVKRLLRPAPNQELLLAAFQEEGWPPRIDDPLPRVGERDPVQCLHDTINRLNRSLVRPLLRFRGDGTGRGVRWEVAP